MFPSRKGVLTELTTGSRRLVDDRKCGVGMSKSVMWDETERRLVFHRPQFVWFSSSKKPGKGKKHISSLSVEQLLKTRIAIRAIPSVQRRQRRAEEIYSWQDECHACRLDEFERDEFHDPLYTRLRKDPPIIDFVATYKFVVNILWF